MKLGSPSTSERPAALQADVLARYFFAKNYCKGKSVLDIGCGFGLGSKYIHNSGAKRVLGIDYNDKVIEMAKRLEQNGLTFRKLDANDISKIGEKFDVVIAFEIVEHLPISKVDSFLGGISTVLKKNGLLLLTTPNGLLTEYFFGRPYNPYHIKEYGGFEIKYLLENHFKEVSLLGYKCINEEYLRKQKQISQSIISNLIHFFGGLRSVRELVAYIPIRLKQSVTKEDSLPTLSLKDYKLSKNWAGCEGLFLVARKSSKVVRKKQNPFISIVIPNYNGAKYLSACLDSVTNIDYPNYEVIVCDDASTDKSVELVKKFSKNDSRVRLVVNRKNLGAASSKNLGVKKALGEIVVFLDSDTEVNPNFARFLVDMLLKDDRLAATQSVIMDYDVRSKIQQAGGGINRYTAWLRAYLQWENYSYAKKVGLLKCRQIVGVSGSLAVRRRYFENVRGFDEKEARHSEDVDFSWRVWLAGGKISLVPNSLIYHKNKPLSERAVMNATSEYIHFHLVRNSIRSILKNYDVLNVFRFLPFALSINVIRIFVALVKYNPSVVKGTLKAFIWNIVHVGDTLSERRFVQKNRVISDEFLLSNVFEKEGVIAMYRNYLLPRERSAVKQ